MIDGVAQPQTTNTIVPGLAPGRHEVEVSRDQYGPQRRAVEVRAGAENRVRFALASQAEKPEASNEPGTLIITVKPFASFYVDDALRESDRSTATIAARAGQAPGARGAPQTRLPRVDREHHVGPGDHGHPGSAGDRHGESSHQHPRGRLGLRPSRWQQARQNRPLRGGRGKGRIPHGRAPPEGFAIQGSPKTVTVAAGKTVDLSFKVSQAP